MSIVEKIMLETIATLKEIQSNTDNKIIIDKINDILFYLEKSLAELTN